jgi:hypothetical protein
MGEGRRGGGWKFSLVENENGRGRGVGHCHQCLCPHLDPAGYDVWGYAGGLNDRPAK